ncbi:hypothetical protein DEU56DRAFT_713850, partial [Suillus clintonianus]|uniref:uncharacterized protein n=1 Tax=Suillus clintonianus TaxID=1904413 RepID=UPI001B885EB5
FRPFPFQPNAHTYTTYELQREDFLTHPHARAALLRGGILWRLCKTSFEGRLGLVNGPSSDVWVFGEARLFSPTTKDEASTWAWDDALTRDEVDLICGVYHVGVSGRHHWETLYWWPRPSEFNNSNLWTGYWNASCEFWFQQRLKSIRCGEAKPFTVSDWKKELKCSRRKTKKLWDLTENASARFIDKVL